MQVTDKGNSIEEITVKINILNAQIKKQKLLEKYNKSLAIELGTSPDKEYSQRVCNLREEKQRLQSLKYYKNNADRINTKKRQEYLETQHITRKQRYRHKRTEQLKQLVEETVLS